MLISENLYEACGSKVWRKWCSKYSNKTHSGKGNSKNYFKYKTWIQSYDARYNKLNHDQLPLIVRITSRSSSTNWSSLLSSNHQTDVCVGTPLLNYTRFFTRNSHIQNSLDLIVQCKILDLYFYLSSFLSRVFFFLLIELIQYISNRYII